MIIVTHCLVPHIVGSGVGCCRDGCGILFSCFGLGAEGILHRAAGRFTFNGHKRLLRPVVGAIVRGDGGGCAIRLVHRQRRGGFRACRVGFCRGGAHLDGKRTALRDGQLALRKGPLAGAVCHRVGRFARAFGDSEHAIHGNGDSVSRISNFFIRCGNRHGGQGRLGEGVGDGQRAVVVLRDGGRLSVHRCRRTIGKGIVIICRCRNRCGVLRRIGRLAVLRGRGVPGDRAGIRQGDVLRTRRRGGIKGLGRCGGRDVRHRHAVDGRSKEELPIRVFADGITRVVAGELGRTVVVRGRTVGKHSGISHINANFSIFSKRTVNCYFYTII